MDNIVGAESRWYRAPREALFRYLLTFTFPKTQQSVEEERGKIDHKDMTIGIS